MRRWFVVLLYLFAVVAKMLQRDTEKKTGMQDGGYVPGTCALAGAARKQARTSYCWGCQIVQGRASAFVVNDVGFDALFDPSFLLYFASSTLSLSLSLSLSVGL